MPNATTTAIPLASQRLNWASLALPSGPSGTLPASWYPRRRSSVSPPNLVAAIARRLSPGQPLVMFIPIRLAGSQGLLDQIVHPGIHVRLGLGQNFRLVPPETHRDRVCHTLNVTLRRRRLQAESSARGPPRSGAGATKQTSGRKMEAKTASRLRFFCLLLSAPHFPAAAWHRPPRRPADGSGIVPTRLSPPPDQALWRTY